MVFVDGISVEIKRKNIKSIRLKVSREDGSVVVSAPSFVPENRLIDFVKSKILWVKSQQELIAKSAKKLQINTGDSITVLGKEHKVYFKEGKRQCIKEVNETIFLTVKNQSDIKQKEEAIDKWYKKVVTEETSRKLPVFEDITGLKSSSFTVRKMKSRWGSCNTKTKKLCFNSDLAKKPMECLEYVIIHELCHIRYNNHKKEFWLLVESFLPDYKRVKKLLNGQN